jgi:hypothetical protein
MDRFRRRSGGAAALKKTVSPDGFSYFAAAAIIGTIAANLKSACLVVIAGRGDQFSACGRSAQIHH